MAHAYTPGLKVTSRIRHRVRRLLPISGDVVVNVGDRVNARDIVAQTFMPGEVTPLNLANALNMPPADVVACMLKKEGERVDVGDALARTPGIFGLFKSEYKSKAAGTIESISPVTGQVIIRGESIPVQVRAFLTGEIVEVIPREGVVVESDVSYIQGIFGIGGETYGPVRMACRDHAEELLPEHIHSDMRGAIVIGGARMSGEAIRKAIQVGVAALVSGGMDDQDLREILGYDLGVAVTGSEQIGVTLVLTEGFGEIAMAERTFKLLASRQGDDAACNGATQIRAGVMRPEIVIPLSPEVRDREAEPRHSDGMLQVGTPVRVIRDPHFGLIGTVQELPSEPHALESGSRARVLRVRFDSGESIVVPRANVEIIGV
ncbi:MAG TPA: hypothetical protein VML55_21405 [Planctomycetaceae bacterium]|nr:hypothetical protein [Planctomycetaceae bacterium]